MLNSISERDILETRVYAQRLIATCTHKTHVHSPLGATSCVNTHSIFSVCGCLKQSKHSKQGRRQYLVSVGDKQANSSANKDGNQLAPPLQGSVNKDKNQVSRASIAITWRNRNHERALPQSMRHAEAGNQ